MDYRMYEPDGSPSYTNNHLTDNNPFMDEFESHTYSILYPDHIVNDQSANEFNLLDSNNQEIDIHNGIFSNNLPYKTSIDCMNEQADLHLSRSEDTYPSGSLTVINDESSQKRSSFR